MYYYLIYQLQIFTEGHLGSVTASTPMPAEEVIFILNNSIIFILKFPLFI